MVFTLGHVKASAQFLSEMDFSEDDYNPMDISCIQHYNPLYSTFFDHLDDTSLQSMALNHSYQVFDRSNVISTANGKKKPADIFIKYAPLLDPVHYLIGKYAKKHDSKLPSPGSFEENDLNKLSNRNNSSYVDNFFNYLSSQVLNHHTFVNGIDYYGSNVAIQKKFRFDVSEDLDYLEDSEFFKTNNGKYFDIQEYDNKNNNEGFPTKNTQSKRPIIQISDEYMEIDDVVEEDGVIEDGVIFIEDDDDQSTEVIFQSTKEEDEEGVDSEEENSIVCYTDEDEDEDEDEEKEQDEGYKQKMEEEKETKDEDDDDDDEDDEEDDEDEEDDDDDDDEDDEEDDEIYAYLYNFPIQMIALEKCDGTFDSLLEDEAMNDNEITSALFQVIFTLLVYQKLFSFTHNDLHTNNILYKETKTKFLYYKFNGKTYKVPTYGKIYKIIDFGRAIYKFQDKIMCSDSFAPSGDAHGQYNFEPYFNTDKPRLEPNKSFDLCRLGCSMYDFVFEEEPNLLKMSAIQKLVLEWCTDDYGKNVLYKKNGDERYPNFKLYKMISRIVHKHTPENQLENPLFAQFVQGQGQVKNSFDLDGIDKYYV